MQEKKPAIVCVDDEPAILDMLEIELRKALGDAYRMEMTESGEEALEVVEDLLKDGHDIALVIADYIMPGLRGDELLRRIHVRLPKTLSIMLTGQASIEAIGNAVNQAHLYHYIGKPWQPGELRLAVKEALHAYLQDKLLGEQYQKLHYLDQLKDQFLANTSHELRTPLNGIIGLSEYLSAQLAPLLSPEQRDMCDMVVHSGRRLHSLVNDLLDFSDLKSGRIRLNPVFLDLRKIAEPVLNVHRALTEREDLDFRNAVPEDLPAVFADPERVNQILHNLVSNAVKFTAQGRIEISAELVRKTRAPERHALESGILEKLTDSRAERFQADCFAAISVSDTGAGIPRDKLERIFESFEQADGSISRAHEGIGLGLSITQQLVERQGGQIFVDSRPGQGARFTFLLPLAAPAHVPPTPA